MENMTEPDMRWKDCSSHTFLPDKPVLKETKDVSCYYRIPDFPMTKTQKIQG